MVAKGVVNPDQLIPTDSVPYDEFCQFAQKHGFTVLKKKKGEFIRLRTPTGKESVFMTRRDGYLNVFGGWQRNILEAFLRGADDLYCTGKTTLNNHDKVVIKLFERDGTRCAYCGTPLTIDTATIEHVVPKSMLGPNNLHNYVLVCNKCNSAAGNLPVSQKIRLMAGRHPDMPMLPQHEKSESSHQGGLVPFVLSFSLLILLGFALWNDWGCLLRAV